MPMARNAHTCLLFDDAPILRKQGVTRELRPPARDRDPVLVPAAPWETDRWAGDPGMSVLDLDGRLRMWYMLKCRPDGTEVGRDELDLAPGLEQLDAKTKADMISLRRYILCYAESDDGVHWEKPDLGRIRYHGSTANNIIMAARLGGTVFVDPTAPAEERLKMIFGGGPKLPHVSHAASGPETCVYHGIYGASSSDGIRWRCSDGPVVPWYTDTTNAAYWDDQRKAYVAFVRWNYGMVYEDGRTLIQDKHSRRCIGRTESADFFAFPAPRMTLAPPEDLWHPYETGTDYYNTAALKYPFAPDAYFLFISLFHHDTGLVDVHLASSRDGVDYEVWPTPYVAPAAEPAFDSRCIYVGSGCVGRGDEVWLFYRGYSYQHRAPLHPAGSFATAGQPVGMGRLVLPRDRFVAQRFAAAGGELITKEVQVRAPYLYLNLDAGAGGGVRVGILDASGQAVEGFAVEDSARLWGNSPAKPVAWAGQDSLAQLLGARVRLCFRGFDADLFSFAFTGRAVKARHGRTDVRAPAPALHANMEPLEEQDPCIP